MLRHSGSALRAKRVMFVRNGSKGAFLCVSEHFESMETNFFFFENFRELCVNGSNGVKNFFFFAFLRISEHFESIETDFFRKFL